MRLVRREQRVLEEEIVEKEGWEKMVEEEDSDMANGLKKLEVTIEEAIAKGL